VKTTVALVHLFFATVWLGGSFFYAVLLLPRLAVIDAGAQRALKRALGGTMRPLFAASALATIASGLVMMVQLHPLHPGSFSHTRWGWALIVGTLASLAALVIATLCEVELRRANGRPASAAQQGPLLRREFAVRLGALSLLLVALATMAVARYS